MFKGLDLTGCEHLEVVSTLMGGKPSCVVEAVIRAYYREGRKPRDVRVSYGDSGPMRETLDAQIAAVNRALALLG